MGISNLGLKISPEVEFWPSTSFGWGKGGKVTSAGCQVSLCDLIWHVISRSGVVISITNCYIWFTLLYF